MTIYKHLSRQFFLFLLLIFFVFTPTSVDAKDPKPTIRDNGYSARFVSQSEADPISIEAGTTKLLRLKFKNTGTKTWKSDSRNYISAYTMEPRERDSVFSGSGWVSKNQIGKMAGVVAPGETGELGIFLHAPDDVGEYKEEFYLASENNTWIDGGYFYLDVDVVPRATNNEQQTPTLVGTSPAGSATNIEPVSDSSNTVLKAKKIGQSKSTVSVRGGEAVNMVMMYQNLGETDWEGYELLVESNQAIADVSWESASIVRAGDSVVSGGTAREGFTFRAPRKKGTYTATFLLSVDDHVFREQSAEVSITVTEDAPSSYRPTSFVEPKFVPRLPSEPRVRVGLWRPEEFAQFRSYDDDYIIFEGEEKVGELGRGRMGVFKLAGDSYVFTAGSFRLESDKYIRLSPKNDPHAVFEILNYDRHVSWKGPGNFNKYRGAVEYRRGEINPEMWIVNDLLFEDYVKGIGENSNNSPIEYLKAQTVAQRSYAYAIQKSDKYGIFDVVATTGDQLYLGFGNEAIMSNFVSAAEATRGMMATYDVDENSKTEDPVVLTPYFAHTNGYTKGWHQVWGGAVKPWLVSVRTEYDDGRALFGHGVGMSQIDASLRAKNEGLAWEELVKYYYSGVEVERIFE